MNDVKCPICECHFYPDTRSYEIEIRIKSALGGQRTRNLYCPPCSKVIQDKGVYHWDEVLEKAIRKEITLMEKKA